MERLDDLDKRILQILSSGANSYEEMAQLCNVTRNTVYRHIASLENRGIIKNTVTCVVNLDKLNISPLIVGAKVPEEKCERIVALLAAHNSVKYLWKTFGDYNLNLVLFCSKGEEGFTLAHIRGILEESGSTEIKISVGFEWVKVDYSPFAEETGNLPAEVVMLSH